MNQDLNQTQSYDGEIDIHLCQQKRQKLTRPNELKSLHNSNQLLQLK